MASHSILINNDLYSEIKQYCDLNGIKPSVLCNDLLKKALNELKYGDIPFGVIGNEQINEHINEQINETLPKEELVDINEMPTKLVSDEIIPVIPMSEPDGTSLLIGMDVILDKKPLSENKKEEDKKITKTKRVRVLK